MSLGFCQTEATPTGCMGFALRTRGIVAVNTGMEGCWICHHAQAFADGMPLGLSETLPEKSLLTLPQIESFSATMIVVDVPSRKPLPIWRLPCQSVCWFIHPVLSVTA